MSLSPGDRIDRYEVVELLGSGGMGEVYRARDLKLGRQVALKILHLGSGGPGRLLREARAAAGLTHPNALAIYDVGEVQEAGAHHGLPYIAMELVVGKTLRAFIGDPSVPLDKRLEWLREVASALSAAHAAGIVHRDVKPENVMIREDGIVKVLDFGIARKTAFGDETSAYALTMSAASVPTLAPEQLRGEGLDGRTDQFAWGVVAYQLVTGAAPWRESAGDPLRLIPEILSVRPRSPRTLDGRIPSVVSETIDRTLSKRKEARFDSMDALLARLDARELESSSSRTHPATTPSPHPPNRDETDARRTRGSRALARGAFGAVALTVVASASLALHRSRITHPSDRSTVQEGAVEMPCTSNRQCTDAHAGAPWHCHSTRHTCVEIASQDCTVHAEPGDAEADDVVWIGGSFPTSTRPAMDEEWQAADLARQDFAQALGSSGARSGQLHTRPLGFVVCDEGADAKRAVEHLVHDVEVPAILGFLSPTTTLAAISTILLPENILTLVTISQSPEITKVPEAKGGPRLVWRTTLNRNDYDEVLAAFVSRVIEPSARAGRFPFEKVPSARSFKVASASQRRPGGDETDVFMSALHINGASGLENESSYRQFVVSPDGGAETPDLVNALIEFAPNVIMMGGRAFANWVLPIVESRWGDSPRPVYLTGSGMQLPEIKAFIGHDASRRRRFFAATNVGTTMPNAQLVLRYNRAFPQTPVRRSAAPQPSYDAFYLVAYAVHALAAGEEVSGPSLSRAMGRLLPPGRKIDVGPAGILEGLSVLRSGGQIDSNGAIGSLDFDPSTGEAPIDYAITCFDVDDDGLVRTEVDSGLVFDMRTNAFSGELHCP